MEKILAKAIAEGRSGNGVALPFSGGRTAGSAGFSREGAGPMHFDVLLMDGGGSFTAFESGADPLADELLRAAGNPFLLAAEDLAAESPWWSAGCLAILAAGVASGIAAALHGAPIPAFGGLAAGAAAAGIGWRAIRRAAGDLNFGFEVETASAQETLDLLLSCESDEAHP